MNRPTPLLRMATFGVACITSLLTPILAVGELPPPPAPQDVPTPGPPTQPGTPYAPRAIVPGGIVVPLYAPNSPHLNTQRMHEAEDYGSYNAPHLGYIVNIHNPSIEFHAANGELNTGTALVVAAGGGHNNLNVVGEGADVVKFFTGRGISVAILRNRLRSSGYDPATEGRHDMQQAIKLLRAYAETWKLDPDRIGALGFSAGGELCAGAALFYDDFDAAERETDSALAEISSRPDFVSLVYPGPSPFFFGFETTPAIPRDAPPAFLTGPAWGDWIHALWATEYFTALLNDGVPNVELHLYARGVHPGDRGKPGQAPATAGITGRDGVGFGQWQERFLDWLDDLGFLNPPGEVTRAALDVQANLERENPLETLKRRMAERGKGQE